MAKLEMRIDMSDTAAIVDYVGKAAAHWQPERRESLRRDLLAVLSDAIQITPDPRGFVVEAGPQLFAVLNDYGLNPVC